MRRWVVLSLAALVLAMPLGGCFTLALTAADKGSAYAAQPDKPAPVRAAGQATQEVVQPIQSAKRAVIEKAKDAVR